MHTDHPHAQAAVTAYRRGDRVIDILRTYHMSIRTLMRLLRETGMTPRRAARVTAPILSQVLANAERRPPRTIYQAAVLEALRAAQPGMTLTAIADQAGVSRATVSRLVRRWQQDGTD